MPKFYNKDMAELAHQLTLSPRRLRVAQIQEMEAVLRLTDPNRSYPFDFVCYRITKYRKRGPKTSAFVPGKALISDLVTMAEVCSRKANVRIEELCDASQTLQQLAKELGVSTMTIRRWRTRGLIGLRAVFDDGVNRLVFCRGTIDRFVQRNKELVERGASFRQLTAAERNQIIEQARVLVAKRPLKLHAAAKIIAEQTGRAVETIRYTLRRQDASAGKAALFESNGEVIHCEREAVIWRCHEAGEAVESIARAFESSAGEIEQVIRTVRVRRWRQSPLSYVPNELFDAPNADALILETAEPVVAGAKPPRIPKDLPPYLHSLYLTPLLTREQEQDLFRRYNYSKYKAADVLRDLEPEEISAERFDVVSSLMDRVDTLRQRIIRANLRLVVSIARKHVGWSSAFFEVISDGNISLMRAVEKFDFTRGAKFSTYATWAVMKNYARSIPEAFYLGQRYVTGQEGLLDSMPAAQPEEVYQSDRQHVREQIEAGMEELPEREREIVSQHFGLGSKGKKVTLEQLGKRFGVTKERVRQIELCALARLREVLSPSLIEALGS